jgi:hypothetical protein
VLSPERELAIAGCPNDNQKWSSREFFQALLKVLKAFSTVRMVM